MPSWTIHSLFCLYRDLLDSHVLRQQSCILHFHTVCISPAHCVADSKLYKQTSRFPKTKKFRAVSRIFFHPQYHGIADRRCFISISWNLPLLFHSCERIIFFFLISFSSDCAWVSVRAAVTVTHSYLGLATCLNICTSTFQLLMINWVIDLLPQAVCSRIKMNSSFTVDLESWEPLWLPLSTMHFYCRASQST